MNVLKYIKTSFRLLSTVVEIIVFYENIVFYEIAVFYKIAAFYEIVIFYKFEKCMVGVEKLLEPDN